MKKLVAFCSLLAITVASAIAGTVNVDPTIVYNPSSAFSNTTLNVQVSGGDTANMTGQTTVTFPSSGPATITFNGTYAANAGDVASVAYYFVGNLNAPGTVAYTVQGSTTISGVSQSFSDSGTITPGQHIYRGTKATSQFPATTSGNFQATIQLTYTPPPGSENFKAASTPSLLLRFDEFAIRVAQSAAPVLNASQLQNISTRVQVQTGDQVPIAGFIVTGGDPKKVIVRGLGPSLANEGVSNVLGNPTLELHDAAGTRAFNDDWRDTQEGTIKDSGVPPSNDFESAIVDTLPAGGAGYTAILRGKGDTTGVGQVEVYDLDLAAISQLANLSTRGFVGTNDSVIIGGFILGPTENGSSNIVLRGIGPSLTAKGVSGALQDPMLELHDANGALVATNDNWQDGPDAQQIQSIGLAPDDPHESALLFAAEPAHYTAIVRGANNSTGVALVEVYRLQQ